MGRDFASNPTGAGHFLDLKMSRSRERTFKLRQKIPKIRRRDIETSPPPFWWGCFNGHFLRAVDKLGTY